MMTEAKNKGSAGVASGLGVLRLVILLSDVHALPTKGSSHEGVEMCVKVASSW